MTDEDLNAIGVACREAKDGNFIVGSFAAEMAGESYPFSAAMCAIVFNTYTNLELGIKFVDWSKNRDI